jgi:CHAT domain
MGNPSVFHFKIESATAGKYKVSLQIDLEDPVSIALIFNRNGESFAAALDDINEGNPPLEQIRHCGDYLWGSLVRLKIAEIFEAAVKRISRTEATYLVRLTVPPKLRDLPWESLYYRAEGHLCGHSRWSIVHNVLDEIADKIPAYRRYAREKLRVLIIIPGGSRFDVQTEKMHLNDNFSLIDSRPEFLDGKVTVPRLEQKLRLAPGDEPWDIIHFIGHGGVNAAGDVEITINDDSGAPVPIDSEAFSSLFSSCGARLVFMNCCYSSASRENEPLSGLGSLLNREGIPAVVSMRYAISNDAASLFSKYFYESLIAPGPMAGRVDRALERGRAALRTTLRADDARQFVTPILHLARGYEQLFIFDRAAPRQTRIHDIQIGEIPGELKDLVKSVQEHRCVPVVGPGLLVAEMERRSETSIQISQIPCGPGELAGRFARELDPKYPRDYEIVLANQAGDWMCSPLLQWVSQYHQAKKGNRAKMMDFMQRHFRECPAPRLYQSLATWKIPALFYTYFDGYLERLVESRNSFLTNIVTEFDKPLPFDPDLHRGTSETVDISPRSLVLLRGSHSKLNVKVALTEDDHDELYQRIGRMDPVLINAARGIESSVLFLGLDPRDYVARQIALQLIDTSPSRVQGPTYFVCTKYDEVDEAYWKKFSVTWIRHPLAQVVQSITEAVKA